MDDKEIQKVAHRSTYLTMHGWTYDEYDDSWSKKGVTRMVEARDRPCRCGGCHRTEEKEVSEFDLETAYWEERERQDAVTDVMGS